MAKKMTAMITKDIGFDLDAVIILIEQVRKYPDIIRIKYNGHLASLKSVMGCMSLSIPTNGIFEIEAEGENEDEIIQTLTDVMISEQIGKPYDG